MYIELIGRIDSMIDDDAARIGLIICHCWPKMHKKQQAFYKSTLHEKIILLMI